MAVEFLFSCVAVICGFVLIAVLFMFVVYLVCCVCWFDCWLVTGLWWISHIGMLVTFVCCCFGVWVWILVVFIVLGFNSVDLRCLMVVVGCFVCLLVGV